MPFTPLPPELDALPRTIERDADNWPQPLALSDVVDLGRARLGSAEASDELLRKGLISGRLFKAQPKEDYWHLLRPELEAMLTAHLEKVLEAGDWALARRIGAEYHLLTGDPVGDIEEVMTASDEAMMAARRVLRAVPWAAWPAPAGQDVVAAPVSTPPAARSSRLPVSSGRGVFIQRLAAMPSILKEMGEELEREDREARSYRTAAGGRIQDGFYQSGTELRRALRALLAQGDPSMDAGRACLQASPEALAEFCRRYRDREGFRGLRPLFVRLPPSGGEEALGFDVFAHASLDADIDGVPTRVEVVSAAPFLADIVFDTVAWQMIERMADENGISDCVGTSEPIERNIDLKGRLGLKRVAPEVIGSARARATPTGLFGPATCRHEESRWVRDSSALRLVCDSCFTGSVVEIPLHQLPRDHPALQGLDQRRYLYEIRGRAAIQGRPFDDRLSFDERHRRDGVLAPIASDFAHTAERPLLEAPRSLRAAMNRR